MGTANLPVAISHLFDHTCVIWRKVETLEGPGVTVKTFTLLDGSPFGCKMNRKAATVVSAGPGIVDAGQRLAFLEIGPLIKKRDLLELITGPDAPPAAAERAILEVENVTAPRGHHLEVLCSEYHGQEPEVGS